MPVALQVLLIVALLAYTESRFDGFINEANITTVLLLAMPLALAAIAQTHAILVGYLDLSVGSMISFGVVVGSFLIGADASTFEILDRGRGGPRLWPRARVGQRRPHPGCQDPVADRDVGDAQHPRRHRTHDATDRTGCDQRRPGVVPPHERRSDPDRVHRHRHRRRGCSICGCTPRGPASSCGRSASTSVRRSGAASGPTGSGCERSCCRASSAPLRRCS